MTPVALFLSNMALINQFDSLKHHAWTRGVALIIAPILCYWVLPFLYGVFLAPTRKVPGPFWARITRWFEFRAVLKGDSNLEYIRLHEELGM